MSNTDMPLPSFARPPVVEVALSAQFEPLKSLRTPHIGVFWGELRDRFPIVEEHPPIDSVIERFGVPPRAAGAQVKLQMLDMPPVPRCWFLNQAGTELIQIQMDRFVHNWRKASDDDSYPRYRAVREAFAAELRRFQNFILREQLGDFIPNQCEVTYVNHVPSGLGWNGLGELSKVLTVFETRYSDDFLGTPQDARLALRYVIQDEQGRPFGRLHVTVEPAHRNADSCPMFLIRLTARTRPDGDGIDGVLKSLDVGREWVVRGFTALTRPEMHMIWRRQDAK